MLKHRRISSVMAAAMIAGLGFPAVSVDEMPKIAGPQLPSRKTERRNILGGGDYFPRSTRSPGPGWSYAKVKRMAKKRRNVLRNRVAHRR